tara:strand:+ start:195 stop:662 length:468 start_codon:yes stop_codon:yes gene_type:complete
MKHPLLTTIAAVVLVGADVNAKDGGWPDTARFGHSTKKTETAELLRKHDGKSGANDSIHIAASVGNIEAGKQHLATESDVNVKNKFGSTPMHKAAAFGQKEVVELLIAAAADVNAKNDDGVTPLVTAIMHKQTEITDLLRKHGGKTKKELETTVN